MNVEDKLMKMFKYIKYDIQSRLFILQRIHMSLESDSNISHLSSIQYHPFYNKVNIFQGTITGTIFILGYLTNRFICTQSIECLISSISINDMQSSFSSAMIV